ncbi:hypothetical protein ACU686_12985 [Yinghuangia aomiensis]
MQVTEALAEAAGGRLVRIDERGAAPLEALAASVFDQLSQARLLERQAQRTGNAGTARALEARAAELQVSVDALLDRSARIAEAAEPLIAMPTTAVGLPVDQAAEQYRAMWGRDLRPAESDLLRHLVTRGFTNPTPAPPRSTDDPRRTRTPRTAARAGLDR